LRVSRARPTRPAAAAGAPASRRPARRRWLTLLAALAWVAAPVSAAWYPDGVDLTRPRLLLRPGDVPVVQARVTREPYATLMRRIASQVDSAQGWSLDDHSIPAEREKSKAAKHLAFLYAIDRTVVAGDVVPFPSPAERQAAGDAARAYLLAMYTQSRIQDVFEDDINTSEELLSYATAYDTLLGAGYDLGGDEAAIRANLVALARQFYDHYVNGIDGTQWGFFLQNNHRSKSGASLAAAGIALAEHDPGDNWDPERLERPEDWVAWGLEQVDRNLRYAYVTGDGAYAEGPYYAYYGAQNHLPLLRAVDRLVGGAPGPVFGLDLPNLWRHPLFRLEQRWMLDVTLPDGSMAPIDDTNVGRSYFHGMFSSLPDAPIHHWAWAHAFRAYESFGSIDLAADEIVAYDDASAPEEPGGSPTAFYVEGGDAVFRSDWSPEAVYALVLAEHGTASEFGRDKQGLGVPFAASHEQAEPGSFLLHAFGERLAIDPGYFTFPTRGSVAKPQHHNVILVDGKGPGDPFDATIRWTADLSTEPPADGLSTLSGTLDTGFLDAATADSSYAGTLPDFLGGAGDDDVPPARITRRFLFPEQRYLVVADRARSPISRAFTWLLHGNGGGTSGGTFAQTATGGEWTIGAARLSGGLAFDAGAPVLSLGEELHELPDREERSHTVLRAEIHGSDVLGLVLAYPSHAALAAPAVTAVAVPAGAGLALADPGADRRVLAVHRLPGQGMLSVAEEASGLREAASDGSLWVFDATADGSLRSAWVETATRLVYDGTTYLEVAGTGSLGLHVESERAEVAVLDADPEVTVRGLAFLPQAADHACGLDTSGPAPRVALGRERVFVLRADAGNSAPAADPGPTRRVAVGAAVSLDGSASCDLDGDVLTPTWELVSAPAGASWALDGPGTWTPVLHADVPGPYRVRLVVRDSAGAASRPAEALVIAGTSCEDGLDNDLDGSFDSADPACPAPGEGCGLLGVEDLPIVAWALRRRRRTAPSTGNKGDRA
jgi:hypothetical protein